MESSESRIGRPRQLYVGKEQRPFTEAAPREHTRNDPAGRGCGAANRRALTTNKFVDHLQCAAWPLKCEVYKGARKENTYLFVADAKSLETLPLIPKQMGGLEFCPVG